MGDATLKQLATELTEQLRASTTVDWQVRDSVRAKMRLLIKRLLKKYKYPPRGRRRRWRSFSNRPRRWRTTGAGEAQPPIGRLGVRQASNKRGFPPFAAKWLAASDHSSRERGLSPG
jgi:hypothetical protein